MIWSRLKNYACPKCNSKPLKPVSQFYQCPNFRKKCDFVISDTKFDMVVTGLHRKKTAVAEDDQLSELNNLDRDYLSEDFSDRQPDL